MNHILRKTLLAGIGAAVITKEKAEAAFTDFVKNGKVSAGDARVIARKLAEDGRKEFASVSRDVESRLHEFAARAEAATKSRLSALEARIAELERTKSRARRSQARAQSR